MFQKNDWWPDVGSVLQKCSCFQKQLPSFIGWFCLVFAALGQIRKALFHLWLRECSSLNLFARIHLILPHVRLQVKLLSCFRSKMTSK